MELTVKHITDHLELLAPLHYAEDFDNVGLLVGSYQSTVKGVLVTLDTLESVVEEAIEKNCNLIVSFHPILFSGIKKINDKGYVERCIAKAIKNDIAIYAIHTALDNSFKGVSAKMAEMLQLENVEVLIPKKGLLKKLNVYVPEKAADLLRNALFDAGAGSIGKYDNCSYNIKGLGTYRGNEHSKPLRGQPGELVQEVEVLISVIFEKHLENQILNALMSAHPYEEVAYEIITTDNSHQYIGMGIIGALKSGLNGMDFLSLLKTTFNAKMLKHTKISDSQILKVALLGGSGSFAIEDAKRQGADAYVSADFKYHDFFKAESDMLLVDIGHYESEQFTKDLLVDYLTKKFRNFAIVLSESITNPINYL